jgi:hypothetical protein
MSDIEISRDKQIIVGPSTVLCKVHGEHLRAHWPNGFGMVGIECVRAALANPVLLRAVGLDPDSSEHDGELPIAAVNEVFAQRPMCYWIEADVIRKALVAHVLDKHQRCEICGHIGHVGAYATLDPLGVPVVKDTCVECAIAGGERFHRLFPGGPPPGMAIPPEKL